MRLVEDSSSRNDVVMRGVVEPVENSLKIFRLISAQIFIEMTDVLARHLME